MLVVLYDLRDLFFYYKPNNSTLKYDSHTKSIRQNIKIVSTVQLFQNNIGFCERLLVVFYNVFTFSEIYQVSWLGS